MDNFLLQMEAMQRLGSTETILRMIPGIGELAVAVKDATDDLRRTRGIIHSMTPAERADGSLVNPSRLQRIAMGSGRTSADVSQFIAEFYKIRILMRKWVESKGNRFGRPGGPLR
jgi:signal recognition particle subunit SRP54